MYWNGYIQKTSNAWNGVLIEVMSTTTHIKEGVLRSLNIMNNNNMNNLIRLTHDDIKRMVNESVHALLKEWFDPSTNFTLSDDFANMANELKEKAWQLEGFVNEFPKFAQTMQQLTQKFGLVLKNASTDDYYDMDNVVNGGNATFEYDYRLPNVDVYSMSDEEYDELEQKIEEIAGEIEIYLNPKDFKFGQVRIRTNESGVDISYEFNFWK